MMSTALDYLLDILSFWGSNAIRSPSLDPGSKALIKRSLIPRFVLFVCVFVQVHSATAEPVLSEFREVILTGYTPLASAAELARRSMTPLDGAALRLPPLAQLINLKDERFIVRVPAARPARGFGVLVIIPPWDDRGSLERWGPVLDHFGIIFVSALRSGNDQSTLARREPLAILAAFNIAKLYPVDAERVFVGGFSGGSRVAMRVALAYPDLFRGALLEAGSDPIGGRELPLPPRDLFDQFRRGSRVSYITGALDEASLLLDADSAISMRRWCMSNFSSRRIAGLGHEVMTGANLSLTLSDLVRPASEAPWSGACWSRVINDVDSKLDRAAGLMGDFSTAQESLIKIDHQYGGLASPRIISLWQRLALRTQ